jgi:drug/metabolite transporter (DMT)-like permease
MIKTASTKYISLLVISLFANMGPLITAMMARFWLGEDLRVFEWCIMTMQISCCLVVLFGASGMAAGALTTNKSMTTFIYVL